MQSVILIPIFSNFHQYIYIYIYYKIQLKCALIPKNGKPVV